jgi:hypothetical protein
MTGTLRVRRSRGALSGVLLVLLGIWGALIPFVGPYFHYAYSPDRAWDYTSGRLWLEILPGLAVLVGGLVVLVSKLRPVAVLGTWLAVAGGAWFAVGSLVAARFASLPSAGAPVGGATRTVLEQVGFFTGLGVLIVLVAGFAMGRFTVVAARDIVTGPAPVADAVRQPRTPDSTAATSGTDEELPARRRFTLPAPVVRRKTATEPDAADAGTAPAEPARSGSSS